MSVAAPATRRTAAIVVVLVGLTGFAAAFAGLRVPATHGAQTTADEPYYLLTAISLVEDGDLDIADELAAGREDAFHGPGLPQQAEPDADGRMVAPHDPLLPALLAGPMLLAQRLDGEGWVAAKVTMAVLAGLLAALTAWTALWRFEIGWRTTAVSVGLLVASVPLAVYGTQLYPEVPAALAVMTVVAALTGRLRTVGIVIAVLGVVALPWLAVKYAPVAAALALLLLVRLWRNHGQPRVAAAVAGVFVVAGAAYVAAHLAWYGGLTVYAAGDHFVSTGEFSVVGTAPHYFGRSRRLIGLLVGADFGIAAWQPAWLLTVPALAGLARHRPAGWDALAWPLLAGWLTATFVALTMQGYWFPGRQIVVVLPLAVLALAWWVDRTRARIWAVAGAGLLGVGSFAILVAAGRAGTITWVVDFAATPDPWYRVWRTILPAYLDPDARMWLRHGLWSVGLVAIAAWSAGGRGRGLGRGRALGAGARPGRGAGARPGGGAGVGSRAVDGAHPGAVVAATTGEHNGERDENGEQTAVAGEHGNDLGRTGGS